MNKPRYESISVSIWSWLIKLAMIVQLNPVTRALNGQNVNDFYSASLIGMSKKNIVLLLQLTVVWKDISWMYVH